MYGICTLLIFSKTRKKILNSKTHRFQEFQIRSCGVFIHFGEPLGGQRLLQDCQGNVLLLLVVGCVKYFSPLESLWRFIFLFHFFPNKRFSLYKRFGLTTTEVDLFYFYFTYFCLFVFVFEVNLKACNYTVNFRLLIECHPRHWLQEHCNLIVECKPLERYWD